MMKQNAFCVFRGFASNLIFRIFAENYLCSVVILEIFHNFYTTEDIEIYQGALHLRETEIITLMSCVFC